MEKTRKLRAEYAKLEDRAARRALRARLAGRPAERTPTALREDLRMQEILDELAYRR